MEILHVITTPVWGECGVLPASPVSLIKPLSLHGSVLIPFAFLRFTSATFFYPSFLRFLHILSFLHLHLTYPYQLPFPSDLPPFSSSSYVPITSHYLSLQRNTFPFTLLYHSFFHLHLAYPYLLPFPFKIASFPFLPFIYTFPLLLFLSSSTLSASFLHTLLSLTSTLTTYICYPSPQTYPFPYLPFIYTFPLLPITFLSSLTLCLSFLTFPPLHLHSPTSILYHAFQPSASSLLPFISTLTYTPLLPHRP